MSVYEARYSRMQIITLKGMTSETFWVDVVSICVIFPQIIYKIVPHAQDFPPIKFFLNLKSIASSRSKMYREQMKWRAWFVPAQA